MSHYKPRFGSDDPPVCLNVPAERTLSDSNPHVRGGVEALVGQTNGDQVLAWSVWFLVMNMQFLGRVLACTGLS